MTYLQPITFYAIVRDLSGSRTEIAEHPDGSMKAYGEEWKANEALMAMNGPNGECRSGKGWSVQEILMVPPPAQKVDSHAFPNLEPPKTGTTKHKRSLA